MSALEGQLMPAFVSQVLRPQNAFLSNSALTVLFYVIGKWTLKILMLAQLYYSPPGYIVIASAQNIGTIAGGIVIYAVYVHLFITFVHSSP